MVTPPVHRLRGLRGSTGPGAEVARRVADDLWQARAAVLKRDQQTCVLCGEIDGRAVVVKVQRLTRLVGALKGLLRASRLERQWRGAEILMRLGVPTARPLALWSGIDRQGGRCVALALERLEGPSVLQVMAMEAGPGAGPGTSGEERGALAKALGAQIGTIAGRGWFNRDHKGSNLIVTRGGGVAVIDSVAIRRSRDPAAARRGMIFALLVEAIGCDVAPGPRERALVMRAAARAMRAERGWFRADRRAIAARLAAHGDPTPKVDPLGERV